MSLNRLAGYLAPIGWARTKIVAGNPEFVGPSSAQLEAFGCIDTAAGIIKNATGDYTFTLTRDLNDTADVLVAPHNVAVVAGGALSTSWDLLAPNLLRVLVLQEQPSPAPSAGVDVALTVEIRQRVPVIG